MGKSYFTLLCILRSADGILCTFCFSGRFETCMCSDPTQWVSVFYETKCSTKIQVTAAAVEPQPAGYDAQFNQIEVRSRSLPPQTNRSRLRL